MKLSSSVLEQADNWSAYWQKDGFGGEVFVGPDGAGNAEIAAFWREQLAQVGAGARIVDLACGAGSIFNHIDKPERFQLIGADLSVDALSLLKSRTAGVDAVRASAAAPPFKNDSFDLVVSQFGLEYAGLGAFESAFMLLKPDGGRFVSLSHIRDGVIDRKNAALLAGVRKAAELDFINLAVRLTQAAFGRGRTEKAVRAFKVVESEMAAFVAKNPGGFHGHLYWGFRRLIERRSHYAQGDILGWLNGMASELDLARLRLDEMRKAALEAADVERARAVASQHEVALTISEMTLADHATPVAWLIDGRRHAA